MKLKDKVVDSVKWLMIAQILSQIVRTTVTILVIRDFDAREMTYVALSQSIIGFFELFSTFGLSAAIIRQKELRKEDLQNAFGLVLLINVLIVAIVFGGAEYFARFYNTPEIANVLKVTSVCFLLVAAGYIPGALLARDMRFRVLSIIRVLSGLAGPLTAYICARNGLGYWSLVYGGISIYLVSTVSKIAFSRTVPWPRLTLDEVKKNLTFGSNVIGEGFAWYAFVTMDIVIAGKFWPAEALGVYALAVQVVSMPLNRTLPLFKSVALPAFSKSMIQDRSLLESHMIKGLKFSLLLAVPMFWGAAASAAVLVPVFLGEKWLAVILPMAFLCMAAPFRFLTELIAPAVIVAGHPNQLFRKTTVIALVMLTFYLVVAINSTSPALLAAVWMLVYPVISLYAVQRYCKLLDIRFLAIMKGIFSIVISGVIMLAVVLLLTLNLLGTMGNLSLLGLAVMTGALVFIGTIYIADRPVLIELLSMSRGPKQASRV